MKLQFWIQIIEWTVKKYSVIFFQKFTHSNSNFRCLILTWISIEIVYSTGLNLISFNRVEISKYRFKVFSCILAFAFMHFFIPKPSSLHVKVYLPINWSCFFYLFLSFLSYFYLSSYPFLSAFSLSFSSYLYLFSIFL